MTYLAILNNPSSNFYIQIQMRMTFKNMILSKETSLMIEFSWKSDHLFLHEVANKQTERQTDE